MTLIIHQENMTDFETAALKEHSTGKLPGFKIGHRIERFEYIGVRHTVEVDGRS